MKSWTWRAVGASAALICGPAAAGDGATSLAMGPVPVGYAAASFESPVAFGASWGSVGIGMVTERQKGDASLSVAAGLGDPDESAGLDVAVVLSSLSDSSLGSGGFGDEGSFSIKLHRNLGGYTAIAAGASAVGQWGGSVFDANNPAGHYLAITRAVFVGEHVLMLSAGAGHNVSNKNGNDNDIFGSASFYLTHWLSVITEYNGFDTNAAVSVAPMAQWLPLTVTLGYVDLLSDHNSSPRFCVAAGLGFRF
ncbi:MAG: hypothetical protein JWQ90_4932 [Hydrocarboniphaga sp.]|nr:hypothetical protein [Hydrocarboniphaga sp.]